MTKTLSEQYLDAVTDHLRLIHSEEYPSVLQAAHMLTDKIKKDEIVYVYGPGGHSNLAAQEIFFRAGGLMHVSAILDEGTLLSCGALRSMAMERTPGYANIVMENYGLREGDLLIIVNAYGINAATIDTALEAKRRGVTTIGVTSVRHAEQTPANHVARHPSQQNLHNLVDVVLDCKVPVGDAILKLDGMEQRIGAISTFANAFLLNVLVAETVQLLTREGVHPPIWMSGNAAGGDELNNRFVSRFKDRIKLL
ncbi:SIS domain-containing protein [Paenibacillus sp. J5C_2022]|uniref:SIS domain-containing protein n=1 Tax=Paenibacillus sp. J5C2022 TaxID=2977129 RepID=UPI0021CF5533|nr:SIS domain-containing protein [Paenibacillus sp. J5C2022]MCU6708820.1 SIS domain-containing protein [Paenibacillus sp. J5C2022]